MNDQQKLIKLVDEHPALNNTQKVHYFRLIDTLFDSIEDLEDDSRRLSALESAGVDNWCGYDYAMEIYREEEEE